MRSWLRFTPGLLNLSRYRREWAIPDIIAGVVLAAVLVPIGMAYAELAGLPPIAGLYASLVPMVAYAIFGPSRVLAIGPDSTTAPLVAAAVIPLAGASIAGRMELAAILGLLTGVIALVVGLARLGFVTELLSRPVRVGYMNGVAVIIIVSQLPKLFGFRVTAESVVERSAAFVTGLGSTNGAALAIGAASLVVIVALQLVWPRFPGVLVVAVLATAASAVMGLGAKYGVPVVGPMPQGLPWPRLYSVPLNDAIPLAAAAVGIAVITLTDTTVMSRVFAAQYRYHVDTDSEIVAIGAANVAAGLFQGFPVSGSQTRTAVSASAGAKSQATLLVAAAGLAVLLVALPWLLQAMPISVLAAIVIVAGATLADVPGTARLFRMRKTEFWLSILAFLGVILLGVLPGVFLAVGLSLLNFVRRLWRPHQAVLGRAPGVKGYHDVGDFTDAQQVPGLLLFRWDAPLFFANGEMFRHAVLDAVACAETPVKRVVLAAEPMTDVDTTAVDSLTHLIEDLAEEGVDFGFAELKTPVREHLRDYGVLDKVPEDHLYPTIGRAVHEYVNEFAPAYVDWEDEPTGGPES